MDKSKRSKRLAMPFQSLNIQQEYRSPQNNIVTEFYIPVLEKAVSYKRSVGYFSSTSLVQITKGILGLIKNGGIISLVPLGKTTEDWYDEAIIKEKEYLQIRAIRLDTKPLMYNHSVANDETLFFLVELIKTM